MRAGEQQTSTDRIVFWGWVMAFLFPIIGFVLGIISVTRDRVGNGVGILVVSLLVTIIALSLTG